MAKPIQFTAKLLIPQSESSSGRTSTWTFLRLPKVASAKLPSRGPVSVDGTINGSSFQATLQPDGEGGHWLKVERDLREGADARAGDEVALSISPLPPEREPEPRVPTELRTALTAASTKAREVWAGITPVARRDWIQWIESAKKEEARLKRIESACDMLDKGKRRPCCFDRSGQYSKGLSCPIALDEQQASVAACNHISEEAPPPRKRPRPASGRTRTSPRRSG